MTLTNLQRFRSERMKIENETVSPKFFPDASGMKLKAIKIEEKSEKEISKFEPRNPFNF